MFMCSKMSKERNFDTCPQRGCEGYPSGRGVDAGTTCRVCWKGDIMLIRVLTIFPEMFAGTLQNSILKRAQEQGLLNIELINIRDFHQINIKSG